MDNIAQAYSDAYAALHGSRPSIKKIGNEYSIVTKTGFFAHYSKRDVCNLTRCLNHMASKAAA